MVNAVMDAIAVSSFNLICNIIPNNMFFFCCFLWFLNWNCRPTNPLLSPLCWPPSIYPYICIPITPSQSQLKFLFVLQTRYFYSLRLSFIFVFSFFFYALRKGCFSCFLKDIFYSLVLIFFGFIWSSRPNF